MGSFFKLVLIVFLGFISSTVQAQDYEQIKKQMQDEFNRFSDSTQAGYRDYISKLDKEFSDYLKTAWQEFNLFAGVKPDATPKPVIIPDFNNVPREEPIDKLIPVHPSIPSDVDPAIQPRIPTLIKSDPEDFETRSVDFSFYSQEITVSYDTRLIKDIPIHITPEHVSSYWESLSEVSYMQMLIDLSALKNEYRLNDWGYYKLIEAMANTMYPPNSSGSKMLVWFLMTRSGYMMKIGFEGDQVFHLLPSTETIYEMPFYIFDGLKYYLFSSSAQKIVTYEKDFPEARMIFDMNIYEPVRFKNAPATRRLFTDGSDTGTPLNFFYNRSCIDFYNDIPLCDIKLYFDASFSAESGQSMVGNLENLITGKTEVDAANQILGFVQNAFDYKNDMDQFNKEKYFFPDDNLFYPFSDCEDRSVLFAKLIGELLHLEVIGLEYPGHMATAVAFSANIPGDYLIVDGKKFTLCDPTYTNAPVGYSMPQFRDVTPEIIFLRNDAYKKSLISKNLGKLNSYGIKCGADRHNTFSGSDGYIYVTGNFEGLINAGAIKIDSKGKSDGFLAKLDPKGKPVWMKSFGSQGIDYGNEVLKSSDGQILMTAFLSGKVEMGGRTIQTENSGSNCILSFNDEGILNWFQILKANQNSEAEAITYEFDRNGELLSERVALLIPDEDRPAIAVDYKGNVFVTVCFSDFLKY